MHAFPSSKRGSRTARRSGPSRSVCLILPLLGALAGGLAAGAAWAQGAATEAMEDEAAERAPAPRPGAQPLSLRRDTIRADELASRVEQGQAPHILDVRTEEEFADGHIAGAKNVPIGELEGQIDSLGWAPEEEIVVLCERGGRASKAFAQMRRAGYENVRLLRGHMKRWRREDRPMVTGDAEGEEGD